MHVPCGISRRCPHSNQPLVMTIKSEPVEELDSRDGKPGALGGDTLLLTRPREVDGMSTCAIHI